MDRPNKPAKSVPPPDAGPPERPLGEPPDRFRSHPHPGDDDGQDPDGIVIDHPPLPPRPQDAIQAAKRSAARQDDSLYCIDPTHAKQAISGARGFGVFVNGKVMARVCDATVCQSSKTGPVAGTLTTGEKSVRVRGSPAARDYDQVSHGGYVKPTGSNVKIGPPMTQKDQFALAIALLKAGPYGQTAAGKEAIAALEEANDNGEITVRELPYGGDSYVSQDGDVYVSPGKNSPEDLAEKLKSAGDELQRMRAGKRA